MIARIHACLARTGALTAHALTVALERMTQRTQRDHVLVHLLEDDFLQAGFDAAAVMFAGETIAAHGVTPEAR